MLSHSHQFCRFRCLPRAAIQSSLFYTAETPFILRQQIASYSPNLWHDKKKLKSKIYFTCYCFVLLRNCHWLRKKENGRFQLSRQLFRIVRLDSSLNKNGTSLTATLVLILINARACVQSLFILRTEQNDFCILLLTVLKNSK